MSEEKKKKSGKAWVVVLCVVLALALIGGGAYLAYRFIFNSPEKKYEKAMSHAAELMDEEEYKNAIDSYKEALEYEEDAEEAMEGMSNAYKKLGDSFLEKGDYEKALSNYKKAIKDVENDEAKMAAIKLCYDMAKQTYEEYDYIAHEEWVAKYDELAEEFEKDDFYTTYMNEQLAQSAIDKPVVDEPVVDEPVVDEPVVDEPIVDEPVIDEPVVDGPVNDPSVKYINVWSFTDEVPKIIQEFVATHPDFGYEIHTTIIPTTDGYYQPALDAALRAGGADAPDIYCAEAAFVLKYTQGEASGYAATYEELGLDVRSKIIEAEIADYTVQIGTRPSDGKVVGLGYQATGGAFIYNRSVAIDTWGTDDPSYIKEQIGGGSGNWNEFWLAAEELKGKGYAIVSGDGDIWHAVENSSNYGWIVEGKLYIDPKREEFLDISKKLIDNGYHNNTQDWTDAWFADMQEIGDKKVLGFFGPAWLINYTMQPCCGGSAFGEGTYGDWAVCEPPVGFFWGGTWILANKDSKVKKAVGEIIEWITLDCTVDGLQYAWANGTIDWDYDPYTQTAKDTVASGKVMRISDGSLEFLGGQNMFDVFVPANSFANGKIMTPHDETINMLWRNAVNQYSEGNISREQAIQGFKNDIRARFDFEVE